jgi:glycosyltransferase involved in cell wall biosynthesis
MNVEFKTVLIISPESWGRSKVSKHHYALAFAEKGFKVYFLNLTTNASAQKDEPCTENDNIILSYINISAFVDKLRFHSRSLYNFVMKSIIVNWVKKHPQLDYLVSFDCNGVFTNLALFRAKSTIFFPVDQVKDEHKKEYKGYDKLVSISPVILKGFSTKVSPALIHHGLSSYFTDKNYKYSEKSKIESVTYVGNLLIGPILDKAVIKDIIDSNDDLVFHFYGAYEPKNNNLGSNLSNETITFITYLKSKKNCVLHGIVSPKELADAYNNIDAFLVCYDYNHDKNECSNSHKIMEYLSTGKPIISTRVSMYDDLNLFPMMTTFDNTDFPSFFNRQIKEWTSISTLSHFEKRVAFANKNTYSNKVLDIINEG